MTGKLRISIGQWSEAGVKPINQDFHGAILPGDPATLRKGTALAIADGISSSAVSQIASETAVKSFLTDYYCTADTWSVKTSASKVIAATNAWLYAETRRSDARFDRDKGYVCTFSAMILKSTTAHLFHVGDSRIYRVAGSTLEQLTEDHRLRVSADQSYLARALGGGRDVEIDYRAVPLAVGDLFFLATDGVYEHVTGKEIAVHLDASPDDLDTAARSIVATALANGSQDNLTLQIVRIDALPDPQREEAVLKATDLPLPPLLEARQIFDGYRIERQIYASSRSHLYLATDIESGARVALKIPSIDQRGDTAYLQRFAMEEWIARRLNSPHVLQADPANRARAFLYTVTEFIDGQTLAQWMIDHPAPDLETVRGLVEQIGKGLRAFHRKEMLHQDLRPENIIIDASGTAKIIDFGAAHIFGIEEYSTTATEQVLGTLQYAAPEYFLGYAGTERSDIYSLGVITYQMLCGRLPYGTQVSGARNHRQQRRLAYRSLLKDRSSLPPWIDTTLAKAVSINPAQRFDDISEFIHALRFPNPDWSETRFDPLLNRDPEFFWKMTSLILAIAFIIILFYK